MLNVEVKCIGCGSRRWEGKRAKFDQPTCDACFMPMIPTGKARQEQK